MNGINDNLFVDSKLLELMQDDYLSKMEPCHPVEDIVESIENSTNDLRSELHVITDNQNKQIDNQAIKISQLSDLTNEAKESSKSSKKISIISISIAFLSLVIAFISVLQK